MQITAVFTVLAAAMAVSASPAALPNTATTKPQGKCNNNQKNVCCNGGLLGVLGCAVSILGKTCSGDAYCCETNSAVGSLVNVNLLNCVKIL